MEQRVAQGHIGLASLQASFDAMGGGMTIESAPGLGTTVTVTSPPEVLTWAVDSAVVGASPE